MKDLFTSDIHFGHENILKYGRGLYYNTIEEHDADIIAKWNARVEQESAQNVYVLGDLFLNKTKELSVMNSYFDALQGKKFILCGNHDNRKRFEQIVSVRSDIVLLDQITEVKVQYIEGQRFKKYVCSHYPLADWQSKDEGLINLHGHCHCRYDHFDAQCIDVGFDGGFIGSNHFWNVEQIQEVKHLRQDAFVKFRENA